MIQQGVSVGGLGTSSSSSSHDNDGMTIGRVMDWTEARLEAIKAQEEEEEEEEEREREKDPAPSTSVDPPKPPKPDLPAQTTSSDDVRYIAGIVSAAANVTFLSRHLQLLFPLRVHHPHQTNFQNRSCRLLWHHQTLKDRFNAANLAMGQK